MELFSAEWGTRRLTCSPNGIWIFWQIHLLIDKFNANKAGVIGMADFAQFFEVNPEYLLIFLIAKPDLLSSSRKSFDEDFLNVDRKMTERWPWFLVSLRCTSYRDLVQAAEPWFFTCVVKSNLASFITMTLTHILDIFTTPKWRGRYCDARNDFISFTAEGERTSNCQTSIYLVGGALASASSGANLSSPVYIILLELKCVCGFH